MVNINSLAGFKAKKRGRKRSSNTVKYCQTKNKLSYIISDNQRDTMRQTDVKNKLCIKSFAYYNNGTIKVYF